MQVPAEAKGTGSGIISTVSHLTKVLLETQSFERAVSPAPTCEAFNLYFTQLVSYSVEGHGSQKQLHVTESCVFSHRVEYKKTKRVKLLLSGKLINDI